MSLCTRGCDNLGGGNCAETWLPLLLGVPWSSSHIFALGMLFSEVFVRTVLPLAWQAEQCDEGCCTGSELSGSL